MATNSYKNQAANNDHQYQLGFDDHVVFTYINQWEKHSIAKIQLAAQHARNDFIQIFDSKSRCLRNLINQLNKQLQQKQNIEMNLNKAKEELNQLREDLSKFFTSVHLEHDQNQLPIRLIKLNYENTDSSIQIDDYSDEEIIDVPGTVPLTLTTLNNATLIEQKQMLGERLFVLVQQIEPNLAAKITGMCLELEKKYILMLIRSQKMLKEKVGEAIKVLQTHQYKQRNVIKS